MKWPLLLLGALLIQSSTSLDCSRSECLKIADPLVREARLIFPDNMEDISTGCNTWDKFVVCLKEYTEECFSEEQRRVFNNAVESPIENIHELCMNNKYQQEYLQYASCIKNTIIERNHCGSHYSMLVDQVSQRDNVISRTTLCCSYDRFKQCVHRETRRICDRGISNGPANRFSMQILNKALRFIQEQCVNYIPNSGDCNLISDPISDSISIGSTIPSESPWSTVQAKELPYSRQSTSVTRVLPTTWTRGQPSPPDSMTVSSEATPTEMLGSRTRPASYGRASSWPSNGQDYSTVGLGSSWKTTERWIDKNEVPSLGSSNVQRSPNQQTYPDYMTSTVTNWYPAAGNQISNEVDEPNQQGLSFNNNKDNINASSLVLTVNILIIYFSALFIF